MTDISLIFITFLILLFTILYGKKLTKSIYTRYCFVNLINRLPGPKTYPFIGNAYLFMGKKREEIPKILYQNYLNYPIISRLWIGRTPQIDLKRAEHMEIILGGNTKQHLNKTQSYEFLNDWLGTGLLTARSEKWQRHRKILTPTFHFSILDSFSHIFNEKSNILVEKLQQHANTDREFNIYPFITHATLDIIGEAAMGTEMCAQENSNNQHHDKYVNAIYKAGELLMYRIFRPWLHSNFIFKLTAKGQEFKVSTNILHNFTDKVIKQRRQLYNKEKSTEVVINKKKLAFLDLLLEINSNGNTTGNDDTTTKLPILSDLDIREEVDTFMFEGHDTTTAAIAWTLLMLALHENIQNDVYNELKTIFNTTNIKTVVPTMAQLREMKLLDRVIKETLRLYPSVPNLGRVLSEDVIIEGYKLPAGCMVRIELVHLHQDSRWFPNPDKFDPTRFLPENISSRHPYAYIPFSAGSRNCIGQKFAMLEVKSVVIALLRNYKLKTNIKSRHEIDYVYELVTKPINGIPLFIEKRDC